MSELLVGKYTLQELNMHTNNIGDDGILVIVEKLLHIITLTTLNVITCGVAS